MSSSIPAARFLLDENVHIEFGRFLLSRRLNFKLAVKGSSDGILAALTKREKRILITNDSDFALMPSSKVYSVIWLRLPQNNPSLLILSFGEMLSECKNFRSRVIILEPSGWSGLPLPTEAKI